MTQVVALRNAPAEIDVSIVMPCLDEAQCLPGCIANAREALEKPRRAGEIVLRSGFGAHEPALIAAPESARISHDLPQSMIDYSREPN
jgi:hypothetical protein